MWLRNSALTKVLTLITGVNAFVYYAPTLFTSLGQGDSALVLAGTLNIAQMFAVIVALIIIDVVGGRPLALYGAFGMATPYVVIAVLYAKYSDDWSQNPAAGWACVAMACKSRSTKVFRIEISAIDAFTLDIYIMMYGVSYSCLAWALPSEVFSTSHRSKGVALSTSVVWISNFVVVSLPIINTHRESRD